MPRSLLLLPALRVTLALGLALAGGAHAQTASQALHVRSLAATCANCHGTEGAAVDAPGSFPLRGKSKAEIVTQMTAFRDGKRAATVMHQLAKGYTPEQIEQLAAYFAALK
jgi:cytochrome c553